METGNLELYVDFFSELASGSASSASASESKIQDVFHYCYPDLKHWDLSARLQRRRNRYGFDSIVV